MDGLKEGWCEVADDAMKGASLREGGQGSLWAVELGEGWKIAVRDESLQWGGGAGQVLVTATVG